MRNAWALCKREFAAFFLTPVGYVIVGLYAVLTGLAFRSMFLEYAKISQTPSDYGFTSVPAFGEFFLHPFLVFCGMMIVFLSPLITMRLMAEERHRGTAELLFTLPLRDWEIVFGKFAAALGMVFVLMIVVGIDLAVVAQFVDIEPIVLGCGAGAVFLMGAAFMSLGLFVSSAARTPITSATVSFGASMLLFFVGALAEKMPEPKALPAGPDGGWQYFLVSAYHVLRGLLQQLAADAHLEDLTLGVVRPQDIVYYVLFSAFFLFLTFRALESRHWRA